MNPDLKLVTVSLDPDNGLEVDWEGLSEYEAYAMLLVATDTVRERIDGTDDD